MLPAERIARMHEVLFSGCRSGKFPLEYARAHHADKITVHAYDAYQARKIREDAGGKSNIEVVCAPSLPADAKYDRAFYCATSKLVSGELELDTIQDICLHLAEGAELVAEGVDPKTLGKFFSKVSSTRESRRAPVKCVCTKKGAPDRIRDFSAKFEASVPGGPKLAFTSLPGCFCHRRADEGGLALAEIASRDIAETEISAGAEFPVLDIGCGCGLVGLLVSDALRRRGAGNGGLVMVDSHTRAIEAARANASAQGCEAECVLADDGIPPDHPLAGKFKIALANPPYYGDGRIAELFASIAARNLAPDGTCYMVAKTPDAIREACGRVFARIEAVKRRTYTVLKASGAKR